MVAFDAGEQTCRAFQKQVCFYYDDVIINLELKNNNTQQKTG